MTVIFYNLLNYFILQPVSPLLLLHVNGAIKCHVIPVTKRGERLLAIETRWSVNSLRSKSTRYYPSGVIFEK